ncbi:MAG: type VI secretion system contractile sheath small subunit [Deltaproteobacteria bacterium HGW-Deltaproteobacteria-15]|jgi:type VI secretion system protein ImpB|nr:MAG: type VI secretion system contractile sheath small subunit [Deltaproteobacteria bacterium HGW-Deltaproteobacteria-15]
MAKEGSVAPKERVNIVYRPATGDAKEEVELPLKVMVMGDFTLKDNDTPVEERKSISVDKDNLDEVLRAQNLELKTSVQSTLSNDPGGQMNLNLDFKSMKDFDPDAIIQKVPELKKMLDLREALKALKGPLGNVPDFRKRIQELVKDEGARARLLKELGIEG